MTGPTIRVVISLPFQFLLGRLCITQLPCCRLRQSRVLGGLGISPFVTLQPADRAEVGKGEILDSPRQLSPGGSSPGSLISLSFSSSSSRSKLLPPPRAPPEAGVETEAVGTRDRIEEMPQRSSSSCSRPSSCSWSSSLGLRSFRQSQSPSVSVQEPVGQDLGADPIIPEVRRSLSVSLKLVEVFPKLVVGSGPNLLKDGAQIGNSLPNFSGPLVEEFSHFCECPECSSLCLVVLESHVETFLCTQFLRTEEIFRDPHPKLAGLTGCFRIWLDWNCCSPALRAFLLAVGMFQIIPVGVGSDDPLSPLQHWLSLGACRPL